MSGAVGQQGIDDTKPLLPVQLSSGSNTSLQPARPATPKVAAALSVVYSLGAKYMINRSAIDLIGPAGKRV